MSLDTIVDVSITTNTANPTRAGFGTPGLIAYVPTSIFSDRSRTYGSLPEMTDDGFLTSDPAYLMAVALKSQNPSVKNWKVLRKALPSVHTVRVTPTLTTEGEAVSITVNGTEVNYTIPGSATVASICTALAALLNAINGVSASDDVTHLTLTHKNKASLTVTVSGVANNETYTVTIDGTDHDYLSDGSATATEIRDGLQAAVIAGGYAASEVVDNGSDALDFAFASHAGGDVDVSATGSGSLAISAEVSAHRLLEVANASSGLTVKDLTADPGIATDWAAITAEDVDFYGVGLDSQGEAEITSLAALVETQRMIYVSGTIDTENMDSGVDTDVGSGLQSNSYDRTATIQAASSSQYSGCRWMGKLLPKDPGSATWAYKTLAGATVQSLSASQESALDSKNINHYQALAGVNITRQGYAASGEFLDIIRGVDWFKVRLQERVYRLLVNLDKIPYSQAGGLIYAEIYAQLEEANKNGVVAPNTEDTPWVITIPEVGDISAADKAARVFPDVEFSGYLAGAVHKVKITGTLSV